MANIHRQTLEALQSLTMPLNLPTAIHLLEPAVVENMQCLEQQGEGQHHWLAQAIVLPTLFFSSSSSLCLCNSTHTSVNLKPFNTKAREGVDAGAPIALQCSAVRANLIGCLLRLDAKSSFHNVAVSQHKRCWAPVQALLGPGASMHTQLSDTESCWCCWVLGVCTLTQAGGEDRA